MSEVHVPFGDSASDTAVLLLLAAQELELDPTVVRAQPSQNRFAVPEEVADKADLNPSKDKAEEKTEAKVEEKPVAKKAPAKKTAAKKTAAKKTAAPKAATNRSDSE